MMILCCFAPVAAVAEEIMYHRNDVERSLILPKGMGKVEIRLAEIEWLSTDGVVDYGVLRMIVSPVRIKYGLTENLQINNAGLDYRVLKGCDLELAVFGSIDNITIYSAISTVISVGFVGKLRMGHKFAGVFSIYDEYHYHSVSDENTLGASLGGMYAILDTLSVSLSGRYEKKMLAKDLEIDELGVVMTVQENIIPALDILYTLDIARMSNSNLSGADFTEGSFTIRLNYRW